MTTISVTAIRQHLSDFLSRVMFGGERVVIERNGKPACALVSMEDVQLLEAMEDRFDLEAAKEAIKRDDFVGLDELTRQLEL